MNQPTLAIDPATCTGWSWSEFPPSREHQPLYGTWRLSVHNGEHPGQKLIRLRDAIYGMAETHGFKRLAMEEASLGSHHEKVKQFHNQLMGVAIMAAAEVGAEVWTVGPQALKKFSTGFGRASKDQMMRACKTLFGILPRSDDEADAIFILAASMQNIRAESGSKPRRRGPRVRAGKWQPELFR